MARSDGTVYIDTLMDTKGFSKGMSSIKSKMGNVTSAVSKLGTALAVVFAVDKIIAFGKEAIQLGSDLEEVQNVVDVTFTTMTEKVDEFAKSASKSAGLSETMAKRYVGTFGSMSKAFGFAEEDAYTMSTTLTQLAGDVASFYNITQDEAYTKLKSVFSGETETLKDLGIVMTQNALDSYAMAKGFGKTTKQMSEQEKVALRYNFILEQLSSAQGDFVRTSDSWANQTRILNLNFDTFKANVGKALINIFTPFLKLINVLVEKLAQLSTYFVSFSEMITGKSASSGGSANKTLQDVASGYEDISEATDEASKSQSQYLSGLDEIRTFKSDEADTSADIGIGSIGGIDIGNLEKQNESLDNSNELMERLVDRAKELANLFKDGFFNGLGDTSERLGIIKTSLDSIRNSLKEIFDVELKNSFNKMVDQFAYAFGQIAGSIASIGLTLGANLIGGFARYLQSDKGRIKQYLISMFDIAGDVVSQIGNLFSAVAEILEVLAGQAGQEITSHLLSIFSELFMTFTELVARLFLDITTLLTQPIIDSKEEIKLALEDLLVGIAEVTEFVKTVFQDVADALRATYDGVIAPIFANATQKITEFIQEHLMPLVTQIGEFFGVLGDSLMILWETVLHPFIDWIVANILPVIVPIINTIVNAIIDAIGIITDLISGLISILTGLIQFVTGLLTNDWKRAWNGLSQIVNTVLNGIKNAVSSFCEKIKSMISGLFDKISNLKSRISSFASSFSFGSSTLSYNLPDTTSYNIPMLASGSVIPPNSPFLAILGDQKSGNNIEAPEELIRKIVREESGSGASGNVTLPIYVDGMKLFEIMVSRAKLMQATTGSNVLMEI